MYKHLKKIVFISTAALLLTACGEHENPMLKPNAMKDLRGQLFITEDTNKCAHALADPSAHKVDAEGCQSWVQNQYLRYKQTAEDKKKYIDESIIVPTFEDFSAPKTWQDLLALMKKEADEAKAKAKKAYDEHMKEVERQTQNVRDAVAKIGT